MANNKQQRLTLITWKYGDLLAVHIYDSWDDIYFTMPKDEWDWQQTEPGHWQTDLDGVGFDVYMEGMYATQPAPPAPEVQP